MSVTPDLIVHSPTNVIGKWGIQAITPTVSDFSGAILSSYATTFNYEGSFKCDKYGYRSDSSDLAWVEMWASEGGLGGPQPSFYCGKTRALEIPVNGVLPVYTGIWTHLGEGRTYNLHIRYRTATGDQSQVSATLVQASDVGLGSEAIAKNPNLATAPTVASSAFDGTIGGAGLVSINSQADVQLTTPPNQSPPASDEWIRYVVCYVIRHGGPMPTQYTSVWMKVPYRSDGTYTLANLNPLTFYSVPYLNIGSGGYDLYCAYQDHAGNISEPASIAGIPEASCALPLYISSFFGGALSPVNLKVGAGPPSPSNNPGSVPGLYFNNTGSSGTLLYVWDGSAWHAYA